jgi:phytanoyl-CoA hydroxylase
VKGFPAMTTDDAAPHSAPTALDAGALRRFRRDGFLVIEDFVTAAACDAVIARAGALVDAFAPGAVASIFSTTDQEKTTDDYFLGSGDRIRFFFEAGAFDAEGRLKQPKALSINKIGHALHDLDPTFAAFSRTPALQRLVADLGIAQPRLIQSMYIFKQPRIGGEVVCHQDATFLYTEPPSVVGLLFALDDATTQNGCLWALPGGHRAGLKARFVRAEGGGVQLRELDPSPWPPLGRDAGYVPLEAPKGTLVLLDGLLPHASGPNLSERSRHAYSLHIIDGRCAYPADNWLQRDPALPARGF